MHTRSGFVLCLNIINVLSRFNKNRKSSVPLVTDIRMKSNISIPNIAKLWELDAREITPEREISHEEQFVLNV